MKTTFTCLIPLMLIFLIQCSPTVKVETSDKPIEINLNVKIEHNIKVKIDKEINEMLEEDKDLF